MKTQIIQLEVHDDTISVKDKMDWSQTPRVLLVWPERGRVLQNRLDLVLLERYSSSQGSQLALLTKDPEVIFQASAVGLPVFQSRRTAQLQPWGKSFREFKRRELVEDAVEAREVDLSSRPEKSIHPQLPAWTRISIFVAGVFAVLAIAGMLLPSATITIQDEIQEKSLTVPIRAIIGEEQVQISGQIPVRELSIMVEGYKSIPATGTTAIPAEYARGEVIFTNLGEDAITIPENTILSTDGEDQIQFITDHAANLLPGAGEMAIVEITAANPGKSGNVGPDQITTISSLLEAEVSVTNPLPTAGGDDIVISAPNISDQRRLDRTLLFDLKELAEERIASSLEANDVLLTTGMDAYQIISESYTPGEGFPGENLEGEKEVRFDILYASGQDINILAADLVKAQYLGGDFAPLMDSITISQLSAPVPGLNQAFTWQIEVSWQEQKRIDKNEVIQTVLGKKPAFAASLLEEELDLDDPPQINLIPSWWLRIPALPFRINLIEGEK